MIINRPTATEKRISVLDATNIKALSAGIDLGLVSGMFAEQSNVHFGGVFFGPFLPFVFVGLFVVADLLQLHIPAHDSRSNATSGNRVQSVLQANSTVDHLLVAPVAVVTCYSVTNREWSSTAILSQPACTTHHAPWSRVGIQTQRQQRTGGPAAA